jgi:hypothetical protein
VRLVSIVLVDGANLSAELMTAREDGEAVLDEGIGNPPALDLLDVEGLRT